MTIKPLESILAIPTKPIQVPPNPRPDRPGRNTNQLSFLKEIICNELCKTKELHDYFKEIKKPPYYNNTKEWLHLGNIEEKLAKDEYYCAIDCIQDFESMILNCKIWFVGRTRIVEQAKIAEHLFKSKIKSLPKVERVTKVIKATPMALNPISTNTTQNLLNPTPTKPAQVPSNPRPDRPGRITNQLNYLNTFICQQLWKKNLHTDTSFQNIEKPPEYNNAIEWLNLTNIKGEQKKMCTFLKFKLHSLC